MEINYFYPFLRKDILKLEKVQRRATKFAPGLRNIDYLERLKILNLTTLEERRVRGDLIQQFKILKGFDKVLWKHPPQPMPTADESRPLMHTRGHHLRYQKEKSNSTIRSNFFNNRIANTWNNLPEDVINAKSLNAFKAKIDKIYEKTDSYSLNKRMREAD